MKSSSLFIPIKKLITAVFIGFLILLLDPLQGIAQTPGMIYEPATGAGKAVLDPNGDGYTSETTLGFINNDETESEIDFLKLVFPMVEPTSDLARGPSCSFTDFADSGLEDPAQYFLDGNNNWLFRLRMGNTSPNAKSYSILIDTDGKFGKTGPNADPTYTTTNPGFEIEIVLATKFGVYVYNIDNSVCNPAVISYPGTTNYQKSIALTTNCSNPDYFYDFFVNFSDLATYGITASTPLRMVLVDNMAANKSSLCNQSSLSDIGGTDCTSPSEKCFGEIIDNYTPCPPGEYCPDRTPCPIVTGPIEAGAASVSGASSQPNGTVIKVFINGTAYGTTTTVSGGVWTLSGISPVLVAGNVIGASATAFGKSESYNNCNDVIVSASCGLPSREITSASLIGKGIQGLAPVPGSEIKFYFGSPQVLLNPLGGHVFTAGTPNKINASSLPSTLTPTTDNFLYKCNNEGETINNNSGGSCLSNGIYRITATETGKCESSGIWICVGSGIVQTAIPIISTNPITQATASISGSVASPDNVSGVQIFLYVDGVQYKTTTAGSGGSWTITGVSFSSPQCKRITVRALNSGKCMSNEVELKRTAFPPTINGPICTTIPVTSVSGTSVESLGTTIEVFEGATSRGTTTVLADGTWTKSGISIALGSKIYARASSSCLSVSDTIKYSFVKVGIKSTNSVTINTITPIYECDASVSGTGTAGDIITLFQSFPPDSYKNQIGGSTTVLANGTWTIGGLDTYCYLAEGGEVTAKAITPGFCSDNISNSVTVICRSPLKNMTVSPSSVNVCSGSIVNVTLGSTQNGIIYQLFNVASASGSSKLGTGSSLTLTSGPVISSTTITVKAFNIGSLNCYSSILDNSVVATVNDPTISIQPLSPQNLCQGVSATALSVTATAGIGTISKYEWYSNTSNSNIGGILVATHNSNATVDTYTPATTNVGTLYYYCAVTNSIGCTVKSAVSEAITINAIPSISIGGVTNPLTCGETGSIVLNFTNVPNGTYNISYSNGSFNSISVTDNTATLTPIVGTYDNLNITVNGCTSPAGVDAIISDPGAPAAPIVNVVNNCDGTSTLEASGYTGSLLWSTGETNPSITVSTAGVYSVTTKDAGGCTSTTGSGTAAPKNGPTASVLSGTATICNGSSTDLKVTITED